MSRAVRLNEGSPRHFHGEVQGTRYYQVNIDFDGRTVLLGCECPYFVGTGPCKHLWAAILEAEKRGLLSEVVKAPSVEVEEDIDDDSELLDDSFVEWRGWRATPAAFHGAFARAEQASGSDAGRGGSSRDRRTETRHGQ